MAQAQHTPGPWKIYNEGTYIRILSEANYEIAQINQTGLEIGDLIDEANANLIKESPLLLKACEIALGHITGGMDGDWEDVDPLDFLRTAIAKARGHSC